MPRGVARLLTILTLAGALWAAEPIRLHPDNPHYFLFRGKPTVLVTSAEHYGAVLNADFDYAAYLKELEARHLNNTRVFAGAYREIPGNFSIGNNTLAPQPARFVSPWPRSSTPGAADGGAKFDLSRWNDEYFVRLKAFMSEAAKRGVVVELNLFCPYYEDSMWSVSPLNARNNINDTGDAPRTEALTLKHPDLVAAEDAMVRKIAEELREFDNLYYEICNEAWTGGVTLEWQRHMAQTIAQAEASLPGKHLISQNILVRSPRLDAPGDPVSIFNLHYSRPPAVVNGTPRPNLAIGNNETGFDGSADSTYRIQGWDFLMAGGALYNNLDYSFTVSHEDGTFAYDASTPGGGSRALRTQLGFLHRFFDEMPFLRMQPDATVIHGGVPEGASARALSEPGKVYAVYLHHGRVDSKAKPRYVVDGQRREATLTLDLPKGSYRVAWLNPKTGVVDRSARLSHPGGEARLRSPEYSEDIALRVAAGR